jgi:DNA-binding winged helix-turn-helix (wHTH) protein
MNLQIDRFRLDVNARSLRSASEVHAIRPKTLALLLFMIERQGQIVSKEQLLNHIWDDVTVNEGVIFQSIREIRQMFAEVVVIQNHPRKGYQWIADVTPVVDEIALQRAAPFETQDTKSVAYSFNRTQRNRWILALVFICGLLWFGVTSENKQPQVVILPVQNYVDSIDLRWLETEGATKLAEVFADVLPKRVVITSSELARLNEENNALKANAAWQLATAVYGDVYDYKVVYLLSNKQQHYEGVVFAHSIDQAMQLLVDVTVMDINQASADVVNLSPQVVQSRDFAQAMVVYETDWETAITDLERYLLKNTQSVQAIQYLSRLYVWKGDTERALELINTGLATPTPDANHQAELLFNRALVYQYQQPELALENIEQGITQANQPAYWLTRAKLEELRADIFYQQNRSVEALRGYLKSQSFYDQIQSPVNTASLQLKLAALYIGNQQPEMARRSFLKAKTAIEQKEMSFLYAALLEFEKQHKLLLD